ncbi:MAG TPA: hypothetical protein VM681_02415, partial [Candidatus Thermoplasmatota archaeon]|nr:hypothetical protein [Candidatus Thermoplasmatota archaeon]
DLDCVQAPPPWPLVVLVGPGEARPVVLAHEREERAGKLAVVEARRRYRYFLPASGLDDRKLARALLAFVGEHDWTSFSRPDEDDEGPRRGRLDAVEIADRGAMVALDVTAPSFRWNQVRRMVEAARRVAAGEASLESVEAALAGKEAVDLGLAPAENLVLLDVDVGVAFALPEPASARVLEDLGRRLFALAVEREVLGAVHEAVLERE